MRVSEFPSQLANVTTRISGRGYGAAEGNDGADRLQSSVFIGLAGGFIELPIGDQETVTLVILVLPRAHTHTHTHTHTESSPPSPHT